MKGEGCRVESLGGGARALPHIARIAHLSLARAGRKEVRYKGGKACLLVSKHSHFTPTRGIERHGL